MDVRSNVGTYPALSKILKSVPLLDRRLLRSRPGWVTRRVWRTTKVPIRPLAGRDEKPDGSLPTRGELRTRAEEVARGIERALRAQVSGTATEANLKRIVSEVLPRTEGLGARENNRLDSIVTSDFIRFRDQLLAGGRSPRTVNHRKFPSELVGTNPYLDFLNSWLLN